MHHVRIASILAFAVLSTSPDLSLGQALIGESTASQVSLIELYTSEGCSSCPPADRWFRQLRSQPDLWDRFVPVGFHVDYWNYLGWRDRFADARFSDRQRLYARVGRTSAVYTPGFIKDGREWRPAKRWEPGAQHAGPNPGVLRLLADADQVYVEFRPTGTARDDLVAHVALLGFDLETAVERGENSGRSLQHDFVVLALENVRLQGNSGTFSGQIARPVSSIESPGYGLAAWITGQDQLESIQATGGWLADSAQPASTARAAR